MPDDVKQVTTGAVGSADTDWDLQVRELAHYTCALTRFDKRRLTEHERSNLEAAKHYIEIALKNDAVNKEASA